MQSRVFIILSIIFICATSVLPASVFANNNFYMQQQMMRNQQMIQQQQMRQQQMQQQQMRQQQMRQQQMQQQRMMRERQQQMQRQMQQRQQQAMRQRQQMAERQRQMQQQRQKNLQKKQRAQGQKRIQNQQRKLQSAKQQQMLRQQRLMKDRQKRLHRLQKQRLQKQKADNKKKNSRETLTMAMLLRQQAKPNFVNKQPQKINQKLSVKQFQQKRLQQQKRLRITKQFEAKRKTAQTRMQKIRLAQKQFQNKWRVQKKRLQQKLTQKQKKAQANFGSCENGVCKTGQCSFHGNTQVLTKNGFESIKLLVPGEDYVFARNEYTGDVDWKLVVAHYSNPYQETVTVSIQDTVNGEMQEILSNRIHSFYVIDSEIGSSELIAGTNETGRWVQAQNLQPGDKLLTDSGAQSEVINLEIKSEYLHAYNITVDDYHTYFVKGSANDNTSAVWVHNECAQKFEKRLSSIKDVGEKVGVVRQKWRGIATQKGWVKQRKLSKQHGADIYRDPKTKIFYRVDTQHGRVEKFNKTGKKHLGEFNVDLKEVPGKARANRKLR